MDTLLEQRKQKRAEEIGTAGLGIKLATSLGKPGTLKVGALRGEQIRYMTAANAREYLLKKGLSPDSPNIDRLVAVMVPPDPSMIGSPVVREDNFLEFIPIISGNQIIDFNVSIVTGGSKPRSADWYAKRMTALAKNETFGSIAIQIIPKINQALDNLMRGAKTGIVESVLVDFKQVYASLTGGDVPSEVVALNDLESISNFLAPKMRPEGAGSTSDNDFRAYQSSILAIRNTPLGNYVSLYTFKKSQENSAKATQKEIEILTGGGNAKMVNEAINKMDKGLYEKYYGDLNNKEEFLAWYGGLPRGALIYNSHGETGKKILETDQVWVVKGGPSTFK